MSQFHPLRVSLESPTDPLRRRAVRLLAMIHELHKVGFQRLRIAPGMASSGNHWRCFIIAADKVKENGWEPTLERWGSVDETIAYAGYTTGHGAAYFGWTDAHGDSARTLAAKFIERLPHLAEAGAGLDYAYAGWFTWVLGHAENGNLPIFFGDFPIELDPQQMPPGPTTAPPYSRTIPNRSLKPTDVPRTMSDWESFALTFDSAGWSTEQLAAVANAKGQDTLTALRARLFFKQRELKWNYENGFSDRDAEDVRNILELIRSRVEALSRAAE